MKKALDHGSFQLVSSNLLPMLVGFKVPMHLISPDFVHLVDLELDSSSLGACSIDLL